MINYYLLTKPGIVLGNLVTLAAGFLLASKGNVNIVLFLETFAGLALIMASACVFNNYIDRSIDKKMERTKHRALVIGIISEKNALFFGSMLGIIGTAILLKYTNALTVGMAGFGFFVYVIIYSLWKGKTIYSTAIGSIAGAIPPVVGYCAVSDKLDAGALIFFLMMVLWQMPHFFSVALSNFDDYQAANLPVLPIQKGLKRTKVHMLIYISGFIISAALLTYFNYTGYAYLIVATAMGVIWLALCAKGYTEKNFRLWGRRMFGLSLITIMAICFIIPFDVNN